MTECDTIKLIISGQLFVRCKDAVSVGVVLEVMGIKDFPIINIAPGTTYVGVSNGKLHFIQSGCYSHWMKYEDFLENAEKKHPQDSLIGVRYGKCFDDIDTFEKHQYKQRIFAGTSPAHNTETGVVVEEERSVKKRFFPKIKII